MVRSLSADGFFADHCQSMILIPFQPIYISKFLLVSMRPMKNEYEV